MTRNSRFRLHAGTASILLVFVTLCLISFAVLSLVNATADLRLSKKIAERNTAYYAAVSEAEQFIAEAAQTGRSSGLTGRFPVSENQYLEVVLDSADYRVLVYQIKIDENALDIPEDTLNLPH